MNDRLCVVMPVYNEREAIGGVLEKWARALDALGVDYVIRPYNDGSKDDSLSVMYEAAKALPRVEVRDKPNGGHGNTILTGYREVATDGFDWVFQIDSDDEMGPEKFGELWAKRADYDFLVGIRDGRVQQLPRKIISAVSRLCVWLFYGKSVWDVNTPYRLMRVSAFAPFFNAIPLTTFAPNVILSGLAARNHLRAYEIRVPQHDRTTGEVSIKKWKLLKASARSFWQTIIFSLSFKSVFVSVCLSATIVLVFAAVFGFATNPLLNYCTTDSAVFVYVGKCLSSGALPYLDVFDHKGPVLYLINWVGLKLSGELTGIWMLESLMYLAGVWFTVRAARLFLKHKLVVWGLLPAFACVFFEYTAGGNRCESYSVFFVAVILYLFVNGCRKGDWSVGSGFLVGASSALLLLLKPNLAAISVVVGVFCLLQVVDRCSCSSISRYVVAPFAGGIVVAVPILIWLKLGGALSDFWSCYVGFNLRYVEGSVPTWGPFSVVSALVAISMFLAMRAKTREGWWFSSAFCFSFLIIALHMRYSSYFTPLLPFAFVVMCMVIDALHFGRTCVVVACWSFGTLYLLYLLYVGNFTRQDFREVIQGEIGLLDKVGEVSRRTNRGSNIDSLICYIHDPQSVAVVGNDCFIYLKYGLWCPHRYPYQTPPIRHSRQIRDDFTAIVERRISRYMITDSLVEQDTRYQWIGALVERNYHVVATDNGFKLWERNCERGGL